MNFLLKGFYQAFALLFKGDTKTYPAIWATVKVSSYSIGCSLVIGIPIGFCLGYFDFRGEIFLRTVVDTLMALPTVFIGLLVYAALTYRGPLGSFGLLFLLKRSVLSNVAYGLKLKYGSGQDIAHRAKAALARGPVSEALFPSAMGYSFGRRSPAGCLGSQAGFETGSPFVR